MQKFWQDQIEEEFKHKFWMGFIFGCFVGPVSLLLLLEIITFVGDVQKCAGSG